MLGVNTPALPASLRRTNQRTVISLLLRMGAASRADLAKAAGISQPTAGKITTELLELGILQEVDSTLDQESPRLGRPGQLLSLNRENPRFLVIEVGVSETSVSALPVAVALRDEWNFKFRTPDSAPAWIRQLKQVAAQPRQLWGVLISVPGIVDDVGQKILFSPNLHWLEKMDLAGAIRQIWNLPVLLVQEIRALAFGHLTADPRGDDFLLVDFGQGVGGAIVLNGKLFTHRMPISGEIGHTPVAGVDRRCGCGAVGCLETIISQRGLLESFGQAHALASPTWNQLLETMERGGEERWLQEALTAAAKVIAGAVNVLGVHRVVITGLLNELPPRCLKQLAGEIKKGALWGRFGDVICQSAPRRRAAGLVAHGINKLVLPEDDEGMLEVSRKQKPEVKDYSLK